MPWNHIITIGVCLYSKISLKTTDKDFYRVRKTGWIVIVPEGESKNNDHDNELWIRMCDKNPVYITFS